VCHPIDERKKELPVVIKYNIHITLPGCKFLTEMFCGSHLIISLLWHCETHKQQYHYSLQLSFMVLSIAKMQQTKMQLKMKVLCP